MAKRLNLWMLLFALAPGLQAAQSTNSTAGLAFPSIQDGAGARAIALGSTFVGIDEGSSALLWNPAGLANLSNPELALHHNTGLVGSTQDVAVMGLPLGSGNGLGVSLNYQDDGTFDGTDANGGQLADFYVRTYGGSIGWGIGSLGGVALGLTAKFNHEDLAGTGFDAFAGDLGLLWNACPQFTVGAAYTNLGPDVAGNHLDQGLRVGISSYSGKGGRYQSLLALSGESLTYGPTSLHLGLEETLYRVLAIRGGYGVDLPNSNDGDTSQLLGWTFGVGLCLSGVAVDYAYVPMADLGGMQRVSVTYNFGGVCWPDQSTATPSPTPAPTPAPTRVPTRMATPVSLLEAPVPERSPIATPMPTPEATPNQGAAVPQALQAGNQALDLQLLLTDADFFRPYKGSEREKLMPSSQARIFAVLRKVSGKAGAVLTINGETKKMKDPYGADNGAALREIGNRRTALVRSYLHKKMSRAHVASRVTLGSDKGSPASIFQLVLR